jgi:copper(I)-binding protein
VGAAYFTIRNGGPGPDVLLAVSSPAALRSELHRTSTEQGMARMRPPGAVEIAAGQSITAQPGGLHVMLTGLQAPLAAGTKVPMELTFRHAGTLAVEVEVRPAMGAPLGAPGSHDNYSRLQK